MTILSPDCFACVEKNLKKAPFLLLENPKQQKLFAYFKNFTPSIAPERDIHKNNFIDFSRKEKFKFSSEDFLKKFQRKILSEILQRGGLNKRNYGS